MNPDPATDVIAFLTRPAWYTWVFWLLLIASAAIAAYAAARTPEQRPGRHVARWIFRLLIGAMWWQQTLWKLPPYYTDQPDAPFGTTGLAAWMKIMGEHASIPLQADFVNQIVLPNFYLVRADRLYRGTANGPLADAGGVCRPVRPHRRVADRQSVARAIQRAERVAVDLFLPDCLAARFRLDHYGRSLGVDALLARRASRSRLLHLNRSGDTASRLPLEDF